MSLVNFSHGSLSDLVNEEYKDGTVYFVFPDQQPENGKIYLDVNNSRHKISGAYDDSEIIDRLNELERVCLVRSTGIFLSKVNLIVQLNSSATLTATAIPSDTTDQIIWTSSDSSICSIISTTVSDNTSTIVVLGNASGTCIITATCGNYSISCEAEVQSGVLVEHTLVSNYTCDGSVFTYTAPISLEHGQYIEASIDVSQVTQTKQNLISFGQNIATSAGTGYRIHCYTSATTGKIKNTVRMFIVGDNTNQSGIEQNFGNNQGQLVIRLDSAGIWFNGTLFVPNATNETLFNSIISHFQNFTSFEVGSAEGSNRSTATYNYIKYYAYEEV